MLLLEHRPAVLVQGLLVECRAIAFLEHDRVGALRVAIALLHEQRLAAPELRFVEMLRTRVLLDQAIERRQRVVDAPFGFVSSRELVENEIVLGVVRIRLEQLLVHLNRAAERTERLDVARKLLDVGRLELQVRKPPHRLGLEQRVVGRDVEKQAIALHRLRFAADDRRLRVHLDVGALEILDRARRLVGSIAIPAERPDRGHREEHEQRRVAHWTPPASAAAARFAGAGSTRAAALS